MKYSIDSEQLIINGLPANTAEKVTAQINGYLATLSPEETWQNVSQHILLPSHPFQLHLYLFSQIYPDWPKQLDAAPAWIPHPECLQTTNIAKFMAEMNILQVKDFHSWTVRHYQTFWQHMLGKLHIVFEKPPEKICDLSQGIETPNWLVNAKMNIANSCFTTAPNKTAIIYKSLNNTLIKLSYAELNDLSNRIANSLVNQGFLPGDAIAIVMPMTAFAVGIYLGIIKMGGIVVSVADSFSAEEIATRLEISKAKAIFTQDYILRETKKLPLYERVMAAKAPLAIVLPCEEHQTSSLRPLDIHWQDFLVPDANFIPYVTQPMVSCNILFSSGTTGIPKAIPWNHTTGIKSASDAYLHQNIQPDDTLAWPTNLGWMMGPWIIFAAFINQATLALYHDAPSERAFGEFIQDAKVTILGVVPMLVANWRHTHCMEGLNWQSIKRFTSTGECSNAEDMLYLMSLAGYKPVIEYCGGTETGGSYIASTMIENNYPSVFTTPAMGIDFMLLDEAGQPTNFGEVAIIPPSIGLSSTLLNADHHEIYYANMPKSPEGKVLRRHGDQACRTARGNYCILGRVDDTMNLSGIKISSAEIERVLVGIENIVETAAVGVTPLTPGPSHLVIYAATHAVLSKEDIKQAMQARISQHLNPLFKIHDVIFIKELPKTASNKIMRRILRNNY